MCGHGSQWFYVYLKEQIEIKISKGKKKSCEPLRCCIYPNNNVVGELLSCELYEWTFIQKDCRHFVILLHSNQTETVISYRDNLTATAWTHTHIEQYKLLRSNISRPVTILRLLVQNFSKPMKSHYSISTNHEIEDWSTLDKCQDFHCSKRCRCAKELGET